MTHKNENRIKILFYDEAVGFGGSVVVLSHLLRHIDRSRFRPLVVKGLDSPSIAGLFESDDILFRYRPPLGYAVRFKWMKFCPVRSMFATKLWSYLYSFAAALINLPFLIMLFSHVARSAPDIIHVNNGKEGLWISRLLRIPLVWHLHGVTGELRKGAYGARDGAAAIVSISKHITSEAIKYGAPPELIIDVPNPAPLFDRDRDRAEEWRGSHGIAPDALVLAHVGRLVRWKGQIEFLRAFARAAAKRDDVVALIVGDDIEGYTASYPAEVRAFVEERGLTERVIFTGHVSQIMELMSYCDIVVHSSIEPEPFGLVIIEAMVAGTAVIAARLGAPIEIVDHGETGLLVDPRNVDEFAAAIDMLVTDGDRRKRLADAAHRTAVERYSPVTFAARMGSIYEGVLRGTRKHDA